MSAHKTDNCHVTNASPPESTRTAERVFSRPAIIAAVFLGLHILSLFWPSSHMWGVDFLYYMPAPVQVAFVLLAVLLFVPRFQRLCRTCATFLPFGLWGKGRRVWISRALVILIALTVFILLSSARHFLGDGYLLIQKLEAEAWQDRPRAPLTFAVIHALHGAGAPFWETAENTYRIYSYISGILYGLIAFIAASAFGKTIRDKTIVLAFLLTAGYMQLFFGYVENYALYMPCVLFYLILGMRALENRMPLYAPAIFLGMLLAFHQAFAVFGPSLLHLAYTAYRRRRGNVPVLKNALLTATVLCLVPVCGALFVWLIGVDLHGYLGGMGGNDLLPWFTKPGPEMQYGVFSVEHILDFVNQQLLAAPVACIVLVLVRKQDLSRQPFLAVCTVVPLFFTFVANPDLGAFRDWDIMSLPATPLTLWAVAILLKRARDCEKLFRGAFLICGAAVLHTFLWIGVNARPDAAEARFTHLLDGLSGDANSIGWMTMARFHWDWEQDDPATAFDATKRFLDADPTNINRWLTVGNIYRRMGQTPDAITHYQKAAELQPDHAAPWGNLGAAYAELGQFSNAIEYTRKALTLQPDLAKAHANLGQMYRRVGKLDKAISSLEKAAELRPKDLATHEYLADIYQDAGKNEKAIHHLERANSLRPRHVRTLVNLAIAYSDVGQNGHAIEILEEAVALQPEFATAHLNLGAVYNRIGQYDNGIHYFNKALEIEPDNPHASTNLGLAYRAKGRYPEAIEQFTKALELQGDQANAMTYVVIGETFHDMREHEKAIPYFQKTVELNPTHPNAHMLLGQSYRALKRVDKARFHFEKTLELEPDHPQADQIRQWLEQIR